MRTESTGEFQDLASLRRDMEMALQFATAYRDSDEAFESSRPLKSAYWVAALTSYGRAFEKDVRASQISLDTLRADQRADHDFFRTLRSRYVVHSVNSYDEAVAVAYLFDTPDADPGVAHVALIHMETAPLSDEDLRLFIELCQVHIEELQTRISRLAGQVQSELSIVSTAHLYGLPDLDVERDRSRVGAGRRRKPDGPRRH